jgi:hypothetical protein
LAYKLTFHTQGQSEILAQIETEYSLNRLLLHQEIWHNNNL